MPLTIKERVYSLLMLITMLLILWAVLSSCGPVHHAGCPNAAADGKKPLKLTKRSPGERGFLGNKPARYNF